MGIRFSCPNGHSLHVKEFLAGKRGICPSCGAKFVIPAANEPAEPTTVAQPAGASVAPAVRAAPQLENPSVVIPVAPDAPTTQTFPAPSPQVEVFMPPAIDKVPQVESLRDGSQPVVVADTKQPTSPATAYVAHRERIRRKRTRAAILLLMAVIVLAAVLIWMLVSGPVDVGRNGISPALNVSIYLASSVPRFRFEASMSGSADEF
jgi:hypothetical protein